MTMPLLASAEVLGGLGIFFFALSFLSRNLQQLASQRLRQRIAKMTNRPDRGFLVGGIMITVTQSAAASVFLLVGLVRAGMLTLAQAQPVLLGVNVAAGLTIIFLTLDVEIAVMLLIGISGIASVYGSRRFHTVASAALGVGFLFLGLQIMREGASMMEGEAWFQAIISFGQGRPLVSFFVGLSLTLISQSSLAVVVVMAAIFGASGFQLSDTLMLAYGANVGSSLLTLILSSGLTGVARQVALYQVSYNFVAAFIMVPLFYLETVGGVPLIAHVMESLSDDIGRQVAYAYLAFNLAPFPFLFLLLKPTAKVLQKFAPETAVEQSSKPAYLTGRLPDEPAIALKLVELEQVRLVKLLLDGIDTLRPGRPEKALGEVTEAFDTLAKTISTAIEEITGRTSLTPEDYDRLDHLMKIDGNLISTRETLVGLADEFRILNKASDVAFPRTAVEGLETIFYVLNDVAGGRDADDMDMLSMMTSDAGNGTKSVRAAYLTNEAAVAASERVHLLAAANYCERLIWLVGEVGRGYRGLPME